MSDRSTPTPANSSSPSQLEAARDLAVRFLEAASLLDGHALPTVDPDALLRETMQQLADTGAIQYDVRVTYDVRDSHSSRAGQFYVEASGLDPRHFPESGDWSTEVQVRHVTSSWAVLTVRLPGQPIAAMLDRLATLIAEGTHAQDPAA